MIYLNLDEKALKSKSYERILIVLIPEDKTSAKGVDFASRVPSTHLLKYIDLRGFRKLVASSDPRMLHYSFAFQPFAWLESQQFAD